MIDAVIQPTDAVTADLGSAESILRLRKPDPSGGRPLLSGDPNVMELSAIHAGYLRPEFTEALVKHLHEAKRLAIQDQQG